MQIQRYRNVMGAIAAGMPIALEAFAGSNPAAWDGQCWAGRIDAASPTG
jgi:hypothetical protein